MSAATSPGTGLAYGLRRVCAAWGMARSSFYAMTSGQHAEQPPAKRRGPKPAISDQALLVAIEADLEASPWEGEGYRKVWARLRVCRDIRVARKRVLRLMRENNLLSPHRCRRRGGNPHDGEIITHAPNLMWGTDGVRVFTVDDGWGWIFTAVEHWNAECVGWHVCKRGDRFAALQPISMGLAGLYGSTAAGAARGLALRMDHGSQYLSDHFTNQIKFWGIQPSYAFVAEPQTNGVAERFNRTLMEQIIHGRIYRNIAELRDAVRDFVELYNAQCGLAPVWWRACCSRPASHLELDRALVAERRVPPDRIVEPVDVSSHRVLGLAAGLPGDRPDQLGLDGLEERLDHSVVVAVALSTHRDQQVMFSQHRLIVDGAILAAAVGMMDQTTGRVSRDKRHTQGTQRQILLQPVADCPADDTS